MGVETPKGKLIVWCINVLGFWILNNFLMILLLKKEFYVTTYQNKTLIRQLSNFKEFIAFKQGQIEWFYKIN